MLKEEKAVNLLGDIIRFKATGKDTQGKYSLLEITVPPQNGPPLHIHNREDESYYVIDGQFSIQNGDDTISANTGTYIFIPKGRPNTYKNVGNNPGKLLIMYTPPGAEKAFEELGQPIDEEQQQASKPPDMNKLMETIKRYDMEIRA
jgi:quercetin dioxygenase-like cupin family protein